MKMCGKIWKKLLIVVTIIVMLSGAGLILIRTWIFSKMSPDERAHYHEWSSKPLHFNPSDIEALPFEMETKRAAIKFREEWDKYEKSAIEIAREYNKHIRGEKSDAESTKTISLEEELPKLEPLIQAFERLVERDDYEIDALVEGEDRVVNSMIPSANFLQFQVNMKILGLKAWLFVNDGKTSEALQIAKTMIRASKSHLYATLISQLIVIAGHSMGTEIWHYIIARCDDPELIRRALMRQNGLVPKKGFLPPGIDLMISDNIGTIRKAQRYGIPSDIDGKTGREIMGEWFRVEAEYLENIIPGSGPSKTYGTENQASGFRVNSAMFGGEVKDIRSFSARLFSPVICPFIFRVMAPNFVEAQIREKAVLAKYDLLRLFTAKKLYLLEHKKEPKNMEDLVPEYIPELLIDPFTEKEPFRKESFFYSIGPDKIDQKGGLLYDPTNGTVTPGDIFLFSE
ncbi:hypothetical protein JW926_18775 [Candidatus Sumerlaeota bacterium]|nr:hypothetical protein [Candidatus Sumerlaeota bacterium]